MRLIAVAAALVAAVALVTLYRSDVAQPAEAATGHHLASTQLEARAGVEGMAGLTSPEFAATAFATALRSHPLIDAGTKLVVTGRIGKSGVGFSTAMSADGRTALVGGYIDNGQTGAVWVFTRSGSVWTQQAKLTADGVTGVTKVGFTVALSGDGNTALIGSSAGASSSGADAAWVFTRLGVTWTLQRKLTVTSSPGITKFGYGVALSTDGDTALIGAPFDGDKVGSAWIFTRSGATWTQRAKLTATTGAIGAGAFGTSVALSSEGTTALIGAYNDGGGAGAAWVFEGGGATWRQQSKLTASNEVGNGYIGWSTALSDDGDTALLGAPYNAGAAGAAWVFIRAGSAWSQQARLTGDGRFYGWSVDLTADGDTALIGNGTAIGAAWALTRTGSAWSQQAKLTGTDTVGTTVQFGSAVAISANGAFAMIGGSYDDATAGAAWAFAGPAVANDPVMSFAAEIVGGSGTVIWLPVRNTGGVPLSFTSAASISGPDAADFTIAAGDDRCNGRTLAPDEQCLIGVQFAPSAAGLRNATLTLGTNSVASHDVTVALVGTGLVPPAPATAAPPAPPTINVPGPAGAFAVTGRASGRHGAISLRIGVPGTGTVTVLGTHDTSKASAWAADVPFRPGHDRFTWTRRTMTASRAGVMNVTVRPNAAARRMLRRSRHSGRRLMIRVHVRYAPTIGAPRRMPITVRVLTARR